jgi:hypothetical protein
MAYQLTEADKKILSLFSMYIRSYGANSAWYEISVDQDNYIDSWSNDWYSNDISFRIESYDSITNFIENFTEQLRDDFLDYFSYEDRGTVKLNLNAVEKELTIIIYRYEQKINYESIHKTFDDATEQVKNYLRELGQKYKKGKVTYEGSGDSGYINADIELDEKDTEMIPDYFENYLYRILDNFGGWEINEGSQGEIYFDFETEEIRVEHGENWEESVKLDFPKRYKF